MRKLILLLFTEFFFLAAPLPEQTKEEFFVLYIVQTYIMVLNVNFGEKKWEVMR